METFARETSKREEQRLSDRLIKRKSLATGLMNRKSQEISVACLSYIAPKPPAFILLLILSSFMLLYPKLTLRALKSPRLLL